MSKGRGLLHQDRHDSIILRSFKSPRNWNAAFEGSANEMPIAESSPKDKEVVIGIADKQTSKLMLTGGLQGDAQTPCIVAMVKGESQVRSHVLYALAGASDLCQTVPHRV